MVRRSVGASGAAACVAAAGGATLITGGACCGACTGAWGATGHMPGGGGMTNEWVCSP